MTIKNLNKHFEGIKAVENVSLSLNQGSITGIYGDNGAGKTSLFNLISGFEVPDSGSIHFKNKNITNLSVLQRAQMGMGRLFQSPRIFSEVTVLNNLLAASNNSTGHNLLNYIFKSSLIYNENEANKIKANEILEKFRLNNKSNQKAIELSVGEKKLLSLGCLLMNEASFILLDELTSGLNNEMIEQMNDVIIHLKSENVTFFIIEHNTDVIKKLCNKTYEMCNGKIFEK